MAALDFILGCIPHPIPTSEVRRSDGSVREQGHVRSREIAERSVRTTQFEVDGVTIGEAIELESLYDRTLGGCVLMNYTPANGNAAYEVAFLPGSIQVTQTNATQYQLRFALEEAH